MWTPRYLTQAVLLGAFLFFALLVSMIFSAPYTGFDLTPNEDQGMVVSRADDWIIRQGLRPGDVITRMTGADGESVQPGPEHYPATSMEARTHHKTIGDEIRSNRLMNRILGASPVRVETADNRTINLQLNQSRPFRSLGWEVWYCLLLSVLSFAPTALIWAWRSADKDVIYLTLSGLGLGLATISAATMHQIEMYYPDAPFFWLIFLLVGIGNFMLVTFATAAFLYFPQKLPHADKAVKLLFGSVLLYTLVVLFDGWDISRPATEQLLHFNYGEVYFIEIVGYLVMLTTVALQWYFGRHNPIQRAESLWLLFASMMTPIAFFALYLAPVLLGQEALLSRTWTTSLIFIAFILVAIAVARLRFFRVERHAQAMYQWTFLSLLFVGFDLALVVTLNVSFATSTIVTTLGVLWLYLPLRFWIHRRLDRSRQLAYQHMFSQAAQKLTSLSFETRSDPAPVWRGLLESLFHPVSVVPDLQADLQATQNRLTQRGCTMVVASTQFTAGLELNYPDNGSRVFVEADLDLVNSLSGLFETLFGFQDSIQRAQIQEREKIRRDLHDQIGNNLLSMIYSATDERSRELAIATMGQLREILTAIKREPVSLMLLIAELRKVCEEVCRSFDLVLHWSDNIANDELMVPSFHYLNIVSSCRELTNNTVRHAGATRVNISISQVDDALFLTYADNGCGFNVETTRRGNGLHNIASRMDEIGARIQWETNSGTSVSFHIPMLQWQVSDATFIQTRSSKQGPPNE